MTMVGSPVVSSQGKTAPGPASDTAAAPARKSNTMVVTRSAHAGFAASATKEIILAFRGLSTYCPSEQTKNTHSNPAEATMSPQATPPAPLPTTITPVMLDTVLGHIAPHFLASANGDLQAARHAASHVLAAYNATTEEELSLAGEVVSFSFHALEALSEAAAPDLSINQKLRLRGSAVSLSREAHKAQRKLDQLRKTRLAASPGPETHSIPATPAKPGSDRALGLIELAQEVIDASSRKGGPQAWALSRQQRRAAERIAEKLKRNKAEQERREAMRATLPPPNATQIGSIQHQPGTP
jgi:hypothetical protein